MDLSSPTVKERILLYLLDQPKERFIDPIDWDSNTVMKSLPPAVTQEGIATATGIRWNHASRGLKELIEIDYVEQKKANIIGGRRRRFVYFLTPTGIIAAKKVKEKIGDMPVTLIESDKTMSISLRDLYNRYGIAVPFFAFYRKVEEVQMNVVRAEELLNIEDIQIAISEINKVHHCIGLPSNPVFGRTEEIELLRSCINRKPRTIVVIGIPGVGKTCLASKFVRNIKHENTFYYPLHEWETIRSIFMELGEFLEKLGRPRLKSYIIERSSQTSSDKSDWDLWIYEIGEIIKKDLTDLSAVIIFDDFHKIDSDMIRLFSMIHSAIASCKKVKMFIFTREPPGFYTERETVSEESVYEIKLDGLDFDSAKQLLTTRGHISENDFAKVYGLTGGHPLALELIKSPDIIGYCDDLTMYIKHEIITKLDPFERSILRFLSVHRKTVDPNIIVENEEELEALDRLLESALIVEVPNQGFALHDVIKNVVYDVIPRKIRNDLHLRAARHFLSQRSDQSLIEGLYHLYKAGEYNELITLLYDHCSELINRGYVEELKLFINIPEEFVLDCYLPLYLVYKGEMVVSMGVERDSARILIPQEVNTANIFMNTSSDIKLRYLKVLAQYFYCKSDWNSSIKYLNSLLNLAKRDNAVQYKIIAQYLLAKINWNVGNYLRAEELLIQAIKDPNIKFYPVIEGEIYRQLALMKLDLKSIESSKEALEIFRRIGARFYEVLAYNTLGVTYYKCGKYDEALNSWLIGIEKSKNVGNLLASSLMLYNVATIYSERYEFEKALKCLREAMEIFIRLRYYAGRIYCYEGFGYYYMLKGNWERAQRFYSRAIHLIKESNYVSILSIVLDDVISMFQMMGEDKKRKITEKLKQEVDRSMTLGSLDVVAICKRIPLKGLES